MNFSEQVFVKLNTVLNRVQRAPFPNDIPLLGVLSTTCTRTQHTDLMIIVIPGWWPRPKVSGHEACPRPALPANPHRLLALERGTGAGLPVTELSRAACGERVTPFFPILVQRSITLERGSAWSYAGLQTGTFEQALTRFYRAFGASVRSRGNLSL